MQTPPSTGSMTKYSSPSPCTFLHTFCSIVHTNQSAISIRFQKDFFFVCLVICMCVCVLIFRPIEIPYNSFIPPEMNTNKDFCLQTPFYWIIREHNNNNYMMKKSTKSELIVRCAHNIYYHTFCREFRPNDEKKWFPITMGSLVPLFSNSIRKWHSFFSAILWVCVLM